MRIDVSRLASTLLTLGYIYVTVDQLAYILGVSTRTAGRILAEMARRGLARRWSRRAYKLELPSRYEVSG
ncbi:hypothetical protein CF15_06235 [Pyrodictium occultum]|uniref:HTH crp-type domain-containing protein n=1 Tax=Pyrodictium occultum TaxID=2309 RepID=A0A0V8RWA3_PYROC|nr:hypothetical protein CF15_06235 [Pyrodictium occultum]